MEKQKKKKKFRFDVKSIILTISSLPMLTVCIVVTLFSSLTIREGLEDKG